MTTALDHYTAACSKAASTIIEQYSTSFGTAVRLLGPRHRAHVRHIYALVRVADELVDGVAGEAGLDREAQRTALDALEQETYAAIRSGYSSNPVVHVYANTARAAGINRDLIEPFFSSMRADIATSETDSAAASSPMDRDAHATYVYGSAEVVGLMCLRVFVREEQLSNAELSRLTAGARSLGAAFQNVNFLRDLADDANRLGRDYLGAEAQLTDEQRLEWVARIRRDLDDATVTLSLLPKDARRAVRSALEFFGALADRLERTSASELYERRVRVPDPVKLSLATRASLRTWMERE